MFVNQKLSSAFQTSVIRRGFDVEKATHKRVDVHGEYGGGVNSLAKVGSPREEDGFHGGELVAVAVGSFFLLFSRFGDVLRECKEHA